MTMFRLEKWYLDAVDDRGRAFVGYAAALRWQGVRIRYHGHMLASPGRPPRGVDRFRAARFPRQSDGALVWSDDPVEGRWESIDPPIEEVLRDGPEGTTRWICAQPKARAEVRVTGEDTLAGYGYTERMELTAPPWKLPIDELRWGRFHAAGETVVWIEWRGAAPLLVVHHNGARHRKATIEDRRITFDGHRLDLVERAVLREGPLGSSVLAKAPRLFPLSVFRVRERKVLCDATLVRQDGATITGSCIHEVVRLR